ncbi:MAG: lysophospholipid acyltransferase family protein [Candidatus Anammoximicrobium sp.]|nr:lysophospholipid acyltransferase family protein [Candidatus Anammoximicrobium sp.]
MKLRNPWLIRLAAFSSALLLRAWLRTVRTRVFAADGRGHPADPNEQAFIYAFWHESLLAPAKMRTKVRVMISQSADGELIAQICRHLGLGTVRGSPKRGGTQAVLELLRDSERAHWAITPDGPSGPRRQVKSGAVWLASRSGLPLVPVGVGFTHAWRASSWDRFAIPRPFSTVIGVLGQPLLVPADLDSDGIEGYRRRFEEALLAATHAAEQSAEQFASSPRRDGVRPVPALHAAAAPGKPVPNVSQNLLVEVPCNH